MTAVYTITLKDEDWTACCERCGVTIDRAYTPPVMVMKIKDLTAMATYDPQLLNHKIEQMTRLANERPRAIILDADDDISELASMEAALKDHAERCEKRSPR